jgi:hypothetical protein
LANKQGYNSRHLQRELLPEEITLLDKISKPTLLYPYDYLAHALQD